MSVPCNDVLTLKRPRYSKKMTWHLIKKKLLIHFSKPESCQGANFIVNDGIRCCQLCRHCRHRGLPSQKEITRVPIRTTSGQSWHHENSRFSMLCFGGLSLILGYTKTSLWHSWYEPTSLTHHDDYAWTWLQLGARSSSTTILTWFWPYL